MKRFLIFLLPLLIAFPALADNGLPSLALAFERIVILILIISALLTLLTVSLIRYSKRKTKREAVLVYISFLLLMALWAFGFRHFMDSSGKVIFDNQVASWYKDEPLDDLYKWITAGCIVLIAVLIFGIYHFRTSKGRHKNREKIDP